MAELNDLYRYATYYDIVFRRAVDPEIDFLIELARGTSAGLRSASSSWVAAPATTPGRSPAAVWRQSGSTGPPK